MGWLAFCQWGLPPFVVLGVTMLAPLAATPLNVKVRAAAPVWPGRCASERPAVFRHARV